MAQVALTTTHPKHNVHKFRDLKPKLGRDNWLSWKRELLATARDRGLYSIILGTDVMPSTENQRITVTNNIPHVGTTPLSQLIDEWRDRNDVAYNQILLCISPELQTAIDDTDIASIAWKTLLTKYESTDPSKISIIRTRYENYHMIEGQSVMTYITTMKEFRNQLKRMGETIPDSTHAATLLRNVPESWRPIAQTIRMITREPDEIEERLEAHEADLNALEISVQAGTAFAAQFKPNRPSQPRIPTRNHLNPRLNVNYRGMGPRPGQAHPIQCNNCGRNGHPASRCYAHGGGLAGQAPWRQSYAPQNHIPQPTHAYQPPHTPQFPNSYQSNHVPQFPTDRPVQNANQQQHDEHIDRPVADAPAHLAGDTKNIIMVATVDPPVTPVQSLVYTTSTLHDDTHTWLIDSAASNHISGNLSLFSNMTKVAPITIQTASGDSFTADQSGMIHIKVTSNPPYNLPDVTITLTDVIYAPKLRANLLSVGRMTNANVNVSFSKYQSALSLNGKILARGPKLDNLFIYTAIPVPKDTPELAYYAIEPASIVLWHHRLAHTGYSTLETMKRLHTADGFSPSVHHGPIAQCDNCPYGKQTRAPFLKTESLPPDIGDIIVSDLCGPFELSVGGYKYFITWIDLSTRMSNVEFLKNKECKTVTESFKRYMAWLLRQKKMDVKKVRTDNGGEYTGKEFEDVCSKLGIIHETTSPYTPEHNGIAERYNRTLQEGALTLRNDADLSAKFWVSAIHTVNFVKNRILHHRLGTSPYEAFWKKKPSIDWLRTYGCKCWALIPKAIRRKGDYKSVEGIFVGYYDDSKAYKIWVPRTHTLLKARDAIFDESNHIERITIHATDDDDIPELWTTDLPVTKAISGPPVHHVWTHDDALPMHHEAADSPLTELTQTDTNDKAEEQVVDKEGQKEVYEEIPKHAPKDFEKGPWLDPSNQSYGRGRRHMGIYAAVNAMAHGLANLEHIESAFVTLADDEPANYREATNSPNAAKWQESMNDEFDSLKKYQTWYLVDKPPNVNIVGSRWTYRVKRDNLGLVNRYKARLVAQGFSQVAGLDFEETYSPTIRFTSIRLILALACRYNLELRHIDVKGAYLNGKLQDDVYMRQPEGFVEKGKEHLVCKLNKGLYGLKQSGRVWHQTLRLEMEKLGFKHGDADPTVFFRFGNNKSVEIAGWYVDDGLLASNSVESMDHMVKEIEGTFDIQDLGEPDRLLGIKITRDRDLGTIHISQPSFIDTIARRFDITHGRVISSPMDSSVNLHVSTNADETIDVPYASLIGSINYCAISTRPDIAYATNKCAQFTSRPTLAHWEAAKRVVRYLLNTRDYGITYRQEGKGVEGHGHNLAGFTDADFAGDVNDRKSTTGWVFTFNGAPISWASKKQGLVTRSSMEAELVAGSIASAEGIWLIRLGRDFRHDFTPIPMFTDNQSFIAFTKNDVNNARTKHIDTHYHYTREQVNAGNIQLHYVSTLENPADILTKPLSPRKHAHLLNTLRIRRA